MTLICLPGLGNTPDLFNPLAERVRLRALSLQNEALESFEDLRAHAAMQLAPWVGQPITLLGYSMGGYVSLSLILDPPAGLRIERLILVNTRAVDDDMAEGESRARTLRLLSSPKVRYEGVGPKMFRELVGPGSRDDEAMAAFVKQMALDVGREGLMAQIRALQSRPDFRARLGEIKVPTLIVGADQDQRTPLSQSQFMAEAIAGARLEVLDGCGHIAPLERPVELATLIEDFGV